jgi:environmental stress-induced protein Ves
MRVRLIPASAYRRVPWNNRGGVTMDIDMVERAGVVQWRVSLAEIENDGPFSDFTGYDRTIVPLAGRGFRLSGGDAAPIVLAQNFVPHRFDGGWSPLCELIDRPVQALNALSLRATHSHTLAIHTSTSGAAFAASAQVRYIVALRDDALVTLRGEGAARRIAFRDTLRIDGAHDASVAGASPHAVIAIITLQTVSIAPPV